MTGVPHTHEAPDDIVYAHAAWTDHQLIKHLREEHGAELPPSPFHRQALILMHAEAHALAVSTEQADRITGRQYAEYGAELLRGMAARTQQIMHTVLTDAYGDRETALTSLDNVEKWLTDAAQRLEKAETL